MPINYEDYPENWKTVIRPAILERAGNCCEFCGVANYELIFRHLTEPEFYITLDSDGIHHDHTSAPIHSELTTEYSLKPSRVVLTIAHLDHDITNNDYDNLRALCNRCHLKYDGKYHARNAARTRRRKHIEQTGQLEMWDSGGE